MISGFLTILWQFVESYFWCIIYFKVPSRFLTFGDFRQFSLQNELVDDLETLYKIPCEIGRR